MKGDGDVCKNCFEILQKNQKDNPPEEKVSIILLNILPLSKMLEAAILYNKGPYLVYSSKIKSYTGKRYQGRR